MWKFGAITLKSQKISYTMGATALLSSFTVTGITDVHMIPSCLTAFFHQVMPPFWSLCRFLVVTSYFTAICGAVYFGIFNVYPVHSACYLLDVQIVLAAPIAGVPLGGDKQV